jgi:hypothetical protein
LASHIKARRQAEDVQELGAKKRYLGLRGKKTGGNCRLWSFMICSNKEG